MIEGRGISLKYPDGTSALNEIDIQVDAGDMLYLIGPSGSGKTSMLKLFMGMEAPTAGELRVLGAAMTNIKGSQLQQLRRSIGPVFQEFRLIKGRTALENVMMGLRFLELSSREIKEHAVNSLERVGLGHKLSSLVDNMSWGEGQRVSIARAVARRPALILADEPTGNLDRENAIKILDLLDSFRDASTAVVITTHATHLIEDRPDSRIVEILNGRIMERAWGEV